MIIFFVGKGQFIFWNCIISIRNTRRWCCWKCRDVTCNATTNCKWRWPVRHLWLSCPCAVLKYIYAMKVCIKFFLECVVCQILNWKTYIPCDCIVTANFKVMPNCKVYDGVLMIWWGWWIIKIIMIRYRISFFKVFNQMKATVQIRK